MNKIPPEEGAMHALLARQIRRHLGSGPVPVVVSALLAAVDDAYRENDRDRAMHDRALEISSRELLEANSQMRAMLQATPDLFLRVGIDGSVLDHKSDPLVALFSEPALEGDCRRGVVLKAEFAARVDAAINLLIRGESVACFDVEPLGANGRVFEVRIVMLFLDQAVIYVRDVSERRAAEIQLHESEVRYRSLFDSNPHPMWVYDVRTLAFMAVNDAAVRQYGYSRDELLAMTIKDIRPPEDVPVLLKSILEAPEGPTPRAFGVFRHRRKEGTAIEVEVASSAITFHGRAAGLVLAIDVTEKRRLEQERHTMENQLEQAQRVSGLGRLAATMAHEFNNVLMGIQPFVELIKREAGPSPKVEGAAERIGLVIKRGKRVTSAILDYTRQADVICTPIALDSWLADLEVEARSILGGGVDFRIDVEHGLVIDGDSDQLQQVLLNLLTNARDAMTGRGTLALEVRSCSGSGALSFGTVENVETFAHFSVTDSGAGIPAGVLNHVFEPLFTTKHSGTGLGLALAHRIVEQHGGHILIDSVEGHGTTVHVFLPLGAAIGDATASIPTPIANVVCKLVLVDDDEDVVTGLEMLLTLEGFEVSIARSGAEAVDLIGRSCPDAVLLDVGLPDMSGVEVYGEITKRWPWLPVIFATGHADVACLQAAASQPHVGFLVKPYRLDDLVKMLTAVKPKDENWARTAHSSRAPRLLRHAG